MANIEAARAFAEQKNRSRIPEWAWPETRRRALLKLENIIAHEGDADGKRREDWYLGELIREEFIGVFLDDYADMCIEVMNARRREAAHMQSVLTKDCAAKREKELTAMAGRSING